jgi:hypothetical protein
MIAMIKIERKHECESFFIKDTVYDSKRSTGFKVSIFGLTLYQRSDSFNADYKDSVNKNGVGFKKE